VDAIADCDSAFAHMGGGHLVEFQSYGEMQEINTYLDHYGAGTLLYKTLKNHLIISITLFMQDLFIGLVGSMMMMVIFGKEVRLTSFQKLKPQFKEQTLGNWNNFIFLMTRHVDFI
jgi:hypothetical protein